MSDDVGRGLLEPVFCDFFIRDQRVMAELTPKLRLDVEKARRSHHEHIYYCDMWKTWTGNNYLKTWYDVKLSDGTVIEHMWPNAGRLSGKGYDLGVEDNVDVRLSLDSPFR